MRVLIGTMQSSEQAASRVDYNMDEVCEAEFMRINVSQTRASDGPAHGFMKALFGMRLFMYILPRTRH